MYGRRTSLESGYTDPLLLPETKVPEDSDMTWEEEMIQLGRGFGYSDERDATGHFVDLEMERWMHPEDPRWADDESDLAQWVEEDLTEPVDFEMEEAYSDIGARDFDLYSIITPIAGKEFLESVRPMDIDVHDDLDKFSEKYLTRLQTIYPERFRALTKNATSVIALLEDPYFNQMMGIEAFGYHQMVSNVYYHMFHTRGVDGVGEPELAPPRFRPDNEIYQSMKAAQLRINRKIAERLVKHREKLEKLAARKGVERSIARRRSGSIGYDSAIGGLLGAMMGLPP